MNNVQSCLHTRDKAQKTAALYQVARPLSFAIALAVVLPSHLASQSSEDLAPRRASLEAQLEMLKTGSDLRVTAGANRQAGKLVLRTTDSLSLRGDSGEVHLPLAGVDSLWVRRNYAGMGFLVGTLIGAGLFLGFKSEENHDQAELENAMAGVAWAVAIALGTGAGSVMPRWKRVYP